MGLIASDPLHYARGNECSDGDGSLAIDQDAILGAEQGGSPTMRRSTSLIPIALLLLAPTLLADDHANVAMEAIRPGAMESHMAFLADDLLEGRDTGTRGHEIAALYVASQFQILGLGPGGDEGTWFQQVPLRRAMPVRNSMMIGEQTLKSGIDFVIGADVVHLSASITAQVVYAGYGITAPDFDYDDYAGIDPSGKIVVVIRNAPSRFPSTARAHYASTRNKVHNAASHGAVGIIWIQTPEQEQRWPFERVARFASQPAMSWVDVEGSLPDAPVSIQATVRLSPAGTATLFASAGRDAEEFYELANSNEPHSMDLDVEVTLQNESEHARVESPNVIGIVEGSDPALKNEYVVFVAHLDHVGINEDVEGEDKIHNGAYDNASGVATLIEIGRAFRSMASAPKRSIALLAVTGEEKGLLGADYFANSPTIAGDIVSAISIDMFLMLYPLHDVVAFGAEHSTLGGLVEESAHEMGIKVSPDFAPDEVLFVRTDHYPFVRKGVPALFLVHGLDSGDPEVNGSELMGKWMADHYHTPKDQMDQDIDFQAGADFARLNFLLGWKIANATERPSWNEGDFFGDLFGQRRD